MKNSLVILAVILVVAAGSFFAGIKYQETKGGSQNVNQRGNQFRRGLGTNGQALRGEVIDVSDQSITIKLSDGSSKIVLLSDKTTISKTTEGSKADIKNGENVAIFGTTNSDASVTAQNIQLNPRLRNGQ